MLGTADEAQAAIADAEKLVLQKQQEEHNRARRAERDKEFWVDGVVGREPTQLAYLVAQTIANITAYFHPDPDNPLTLKSVER